MAEGLVYKIGADIENLEKAVARVEVLLKDLSKAIGQQTVTAVNTGNKALDSFGQSDSVKQVTEQVNQLSTSADKASTEIDGLSKSIKSVPSVKKDVIPLTLPDTLDKTKKKAVDGAFALNSLGNVAKDLPFGFIAIQNNIPGVFESFGALTKQSGSVLGAFKALGSSLVGPAGIAFAIGAITAGITSLIQKYGSLANAIDVIFAKNKELAALQQEFNKTIFQTTGELAAENAKVDILTKTIANNKTSQDKRIAAYYELKKIAPEVVAGIKDENFGTEASNLLVAANAQLRKESIRLKIQESGINAVLAKNAADKAVQEFELNRLAQKRLELIDKINKNEFKPTPTNNFDIRLSQLSELEADIIKQTKVVNNLYGIENKYLKQLEPITLGINDITEATRLQIEQVKKQEKAEKKTAAELLKASNAAKNYKYELQSLSEFKLNPEQLDVKNQIERLQELANVVLNVKASEEKRLAALKELQSIDPAYFNGLNLQAQNYGKLKAAIDLINKDYLTQLTLLERISKVPVKVEVPTKKDKPNLINAPITGIEAPIKLPAAFDEFDKKQKEAADSLKANLAATYNILNDTFFSPIQDLFSNFLETGKFAIADFGKAVLKAINQIVAKIIATGIITLLANLLLPGFGKASGGLGKSLLTAIGSALGFNLGGNVAAPSFAGVGGGSLGMSGQVNVVLRGSDLVGSINRTNATINRVG